MSLRASEARKTLVPLIGRGDADRDAVEIVSRKGNVVLMPADGDAWVRLVSDRSAREDYTHWQTTDRKVRTRINTLIDAGLRDPFEGIGKPGQLKYGAAGAWSRRITEEHRLVYIVDGEVLIILQVRYHY